MIKYNRKEVSNYAKLRDLKFFMLFILDFPFSIPLPPIFEMFIGSIFIEPFQEKRKRYFAVCSERYWSTSIDIPGREVVSATIRPDKLDESVEYKQQSTRVKLIVQVYDDEVEKVKEFLDVSSFRSALLIRLLSILEIKLVEIKGFSFGSEYINYGADRVLLFQYDDNVDRLEMIQSKITCSYVINWSHEMVVGSNDFLTSDDICMWRYYANRCEIAFNRKQNTDCVLYAAMSIEAYIYQLMIDNNLFDYFNSIKNKDSRMLNKYKNGEISGDEFLRLIRESNNYYDSVFGKTAFLLDNNIISEAMKRNIEKSFGKINQTRNAIVHGNLNSVLISDAIAKNAYKSMIEVFSEFGFDKPIFNQPDFIRIGKEMDEVSNRCNQNDNSTEVEFLHYKNRNMYFSFSCFNLGIINYRKRKYDEAKEYFLICIERRRYMIESYYYLAKIAYYQKNEELMKQYKNEGLSLVSELSIRDRFNSYDFDVISSYVDALRKI